MRYRAFLELHLRAAARTAEGYFGKVSGTVKPGDPNQVLTEADVAIGKQLVAAVRQEYPDHNVIDEEAGVIDRGSVYTWIIDPIEATSNFAAGLPQYGIMIGLLENDTPIAGGVIAPAYNKLYLAEKGQGATCNGEPIRVTTETDLLKMLVSFGIDSHKDNPKRTYLECQVLADIVQASRTMRNSGCEALDPMYVAEGRFGGRVNMSARIWDNVGPQVIAEEAGARWTALDGSPMDYRQPLTKTDQNMPFCVAPPVLHDHLIKLIDGRL
jgi:myo-inositol-1(or 4)-monophosphatase